MYSFLQLSSQLSLLPLNLVASFADWVGPLFPNGPLSGGFLVPDFLAVLDGIGYCLLLKSSLHGALLVP